MIPLGTDLELMSRPLATVSLIAVNVIVFYATELYVDMYYFETYTSCLHTIASVFLHGHIYHLFGNMLFLWVFGRFLEDRIGSGRFLLYYSMCAIGSTLFHTVVDGRSAIGASGAISGVMGIYLYRCHYSRIRAVMPLLIFFFPVIIRAKWLVLLWILWDVYDAFFTEHTIAHWAHIGGFLTGVVIGKMNNYWNKATVEHLYTGAPDPPVEYDTPCPQSLSTRCILISPVNPWLLERYNIN